MSTTPSASFDPLSILPSAKTAPIPPAKYIEEREKQWFFSDDEVAHPPSVEDGMALEKETDIRVKGIHFILKVAVMLGLPSMIISTASAFFHRFLMRYSLVPYTDEITGKLIKPLHHYQIGGTALFLATKSRETPRKLKDLVVACCRVAQKNPSLQVLEDSKDYWKWRDSLVHTEDLFLERLEFDTTVLIPQDAFYDLLRRLGFTIDESLNPLRAAAWAFLNDSNITTLRLQFSAMTLAATALYAAAQRVGISDQFPDGARGRAWWEAVGVTLRDIRKCANTLADLYEKDPEMLCDKNDNSDLYESLYSPVDGDEKDDAKTSRKRSASEALESREGGSVGSASKRRSPDKDLGVPPAGRASRAANNESEPEAKQQSKAPAANSTNGTRKPDKDDAGSEEGEVEE